MKHIIPAIACAYLFTQHIGEEVHEYAVLLRVLEAQRADGVNDDDLQHGVHQSVALCCTELAWKHATPAHANPRDSHTYPFFLMSHTSFHVYHVLPYT